MLKNVTLRDYQDKILKDLAYVPSIGLFMKTGSGKTLTSLERVLQNKTKNLLVVCPQKIITQWWDVIEKHTDFKVCKYTLSWSANKKNDTINYHLINGNANCIVINFEILEKITSIDNFIDNNWTIIIDESHKIKNLGTTRRPVKTTRRCLQLGTKTPYKIILTATPTEKENGGYIDLYTQLKFLGYIDYNDKYFENYFCITQKMQLPGMPFPIKKITGYRTDRIEKI